MQIELNKKHVTVTPTKIHKQEEYVYIRKISHYFSL